jgi:hypothetical protein
MITCSVLRCQLPGSAFVVGRRMSDGFREAYLCQAYVCGEHKTMIEAGCRWELQEDYVLLEPDLPPMLEGWSAHSSVGTEGIRLRLETSASSPPFEVFLTPDDARKLALIIGPPTGAMWSPAFWEGRTGSEED